MAKKKGKRRYYGRKKRGRKKTSMKRKISLAAQTAMAFFPEIRTLADCVADEQWTRFPVRWVSHRTGYNYETGAFEWEKAVANNAVSIGGPLLIRWSMRNVK